MQSSPCEDGILVLSVEKRMENRVFQRNPDRDCSLVHSMEKRGDAVLQSNPAGDGILVLSMEKRV